MGMGIVLGYAGYWVTRLAKLYESAEETIAFSAALALLGFFLGGIFMH